MYARMLGMDLHDEAEDARRAVMAASRAFVGLAARSLAEVGDDVSLAQYRVLVLLDERGSMSMGELADNLDVNPSTVTRVCDALVVKRLVVRASSAADRRSVCAELAPRGRELVRQVMARRRHLVEGILGRMSPRKQRRLATSLREFAQASGELSERAWTLGWSSADEDSTAG